MDIFDREESMRIVMTFSQHDLNLLRTKYDIEDKEDLYYAIWDMINTYIYQ